MDLLSLISSSAVPVDNGDRLLVIIDNVGTSTAAFVLRYTQINSLGQPVTSTQTFSVAAGTAGSIQPFVLTKGQLATVSLTLTTTLFGSGQAYAVFAIQRGQVQSTATREALTAGYVTSKTPLNYPLSPTQATDAIWSLPFVHQLGDPGAASEIAESINGANPANVLGLRATFTADANAANRRINLNWSVDGQIIWQARNRTNITATQAWTVQLWQGGNIPAEDTVNFITYIAIPNTLAGVNMTLTSITENMQVGDAYTQIFVNASEQAAP